MATPSMGSQNTLISNASKGEIIENITSKKKGNVQKWEDLKQFMWDTQNRKLLGRTSFKWMQVGLFYLGFYTVLLAYGMAIGFIFMYVLIDWNHPTLQNKASSLLYNPGLMFRPMPDHQSSLIRFEQGKPTSYKPFVDHMGAFLDQYEESMQKGENFYDCSNGKPPEMINKVCPFHLNELSPCIKENDFGYDEGRPCILFKLNKIYGWRPEDYYNISYAPEIVRDRWQKGYIAVSCEGEEPEDRENIGNITYIPAQGYPGFFFPYLNQEGFRSPLMMAKFENPANGVLIRIICKAWLPNIRHNRNDMDGSVHFELLVD